MNSESINGSDYTAESFRRNTLPRMSPSTIHEVLHRIGQTFSHVQYAVCGTAAMAAYGFTDRLPTHVNIVSPSSTRDVMIPWAASGGMTTDLSEPDTVGVTVDGETWKVYFNYLDMDEDHRFERLESVGMVFGHGVATKVLTMPAIINHNALAYIEDEMSRSWRYRKRLADNITWLLERISKGDMEGHSLTRARIPSVRDPTFWLVFTTAHPEAAGLFYDAGLRPEVEEPGSEGSGGDWGDWELREEEPARDCNHGDWEGWEEEEQWRPESSTSSHAPLLAQEDGSSLESEPSRRNPSFAHSRNHHGHRSRPRAPSRHEPNLTRAEERRVIMDSRPRSSGERRFPRVFSLSSALEDLLHGNFRHDFRK
ncbi:hypothetical protein CkaCkLH20_12597 [Colletotrichum karsti]|uniref:Uncharacterized protein n=1 Tax=Colletotrichum karsti TaxID=1095194 RepID=A0A9P6HSZ8_9PEZI|nr:uncharacterized protein CkaCkLH20_12597 [Colletotrichum karsti]KAF9869988.1 hypothetical protein CkaCkLH20_12597 [Colletotrichum karsti]